jgi:hypothetical protein
MTSALSPLYKIGLGSSLAVKISRKYMMCGSLVQWRIICLIVICYICSEAFITVTIPIVVVTWMAVT